MKGIRRSDDGVDFDLHLSMRRSNVRGGENEDPFFGSRHLEVSDDGRGRT